MCARYVCKSAEHKINLWLPKEKFGNHIVRSITGRSSQSQVKSSKGLEGNAACPPPSSMLRATLLATCALGAASAVVPSGKEVELSPGIMM